MEAFFQAFRKEQIFRHPLIILVRARMYFEGKYFKAVLVIKSSPGDFLVGNLLIIFFTVPGVVK